MTFQNFGLIPELVRAIDDLGYTEPTPIQQKAIPVILHGTDVIALAQTGTGKTAGFTLPLLQLLHAKNDSSESTRHPRALILAPTRELCAQIGESVKSYGKYLSLRAETIFGGVNITTQIRKLHKGSDIIIATPGRLLDLVHQKAISLSKIEVLVLDEADRMLDMGFINDITKILALLPRQRQNMLFSATFSSEIQALASSILRNHKLIEVAKRNITTELVSQVVYQVDQKRKRELISYLIGSNNWQQVLIFVRTKHNASKLCNQLIEDGLTAAALHGDKSQGARTRALEEFKSGKVNVLVATDIAARGIDIDHLPYVVNFELPRIAEDYVHRIGRTGRAGKSGTAISLVSPDETPFLVDIERLTKKTIARKVLPGYEPEKTFTIRTNNTRSNTARNDRKPSTQRGFGKPADRNSKFGAKSHTDEKSGNRRFSAKPTGRTTEGRGRSWQSDAKPGSRSFEGRRNDRQSDGRDNVRSFEGKRSNWNSESKPGSRSFEGRRNDRQSDNRDNVRSFEGKRGNWNSDSRSARSSEGRGRSWQSDARPGSRSFDSRRNYRQSDGTDNVSSFEGKRSNWNSDSRPARSSEGRGRSWQSDARPGSRSFEGRSNERQSDNRDNVRSFEGKRSKWNSDSRPARSSEGRGRSWQSDSMPDSRSFEGKRTVRQSDARPGSRSFEGKRTVRQSDARPGSRSFEGKRTLRLSDARPARSFEGKRNNRQSDFRSKARS